jgi:Zn-dependent oligopeptidase
MFHEFGHALHGMFSNVKYPTLAGTATSRDFVEFPSQFNEHWATDPKVFAHYAKHYQTGEAMPQALVDKIKKARTFNQGYATTEYLSAALLDLAWHTLPADAPLQDVDLRDGSAEEVQGRPAAGAAALSHQLLRPHLGRRLFGRLLRLLLVGSAGR